LVDYRVTGQYRQDIHASVCAESTEEAATKAANLFQKWLEEGLMSEMEGISFGPDEPSLDEEVHVTQAKDATVESPTYWTDIEEVEIRQKGDGAWEAAVTP